ncbi:Beta-galactosidase 5 [Phytophthora cinnamomi]|uniref:Beta-galactosidase 5 n=1 Tax=Phytophthora cinnamomi TaxID=4785 RepID=UPI00355A9F6F|nr:Beta-galactosidase 5 [Phytophthora cinnamomi]
MARRAYQDFVASPYNLQSMRSYYQRRPTNGRLSSPRLAESGEVALRHHINRMNQLKMKIEAFRCRYFRSLSDECFYQWKAFSAFKQKLRTVRQQTLQSQRRRRLHQWRGITVEQARRRTGMQLMAVKRRHRDLVAWFSHWESVCTDLWLNQELVAHHQRHAHKQRLLRSAVAALRAQLPARSQRLKCRSFFLQHHSAFLVQVLQRWRAACDHQKATSTCDV